MTLRYRDGDETNAFEGGIFSSEADMTRPKTSPEPEAVPVDGGQATNVSDRLTSQTSTSSNSALETLHEDTDVLRVV